VQYNNSNNNSITVKIRMCPNAVEVVLMSSELTVCNQISVMQSHSHCRFDTPQSTNKFQITDKQINK